MQYKQQKNIGAIYGNGAIDKSNVCKLFNRWIRGNFDLESQELYAVLDDERKKSASCYQFLVKIITFTSTTIYPRNNVKLSLLPAAWADGTL